MAGQGLWLAWPTSLARADRTASAAPPWLAAPCLARPAVRSPLQGHGSWHPRRVA